MRLYYLAEETTEVSKFQEIINFIKNLFNNPFIKVLVATLVFILFNMVAYNFNFEKASQKSNETYQR